VVSWFKKIQGEYKMTTLRGREATKFFERLKREENIKLSLVPTPKLKEVRQEILRDAIEYTEGFLVGQAVAYCEQITLGSRSAGLIDCRQEDVDILIQTVEEEECNYRVILTDHGRAGFWIYRYKFVETVIDYMESASNNERSSAFDIWVAGKLFGYADCEIANCIADNHSFYAL
jgi:hypothetical protein